MSQTKRSRRARKLSPVHPSAATAPAAVTHAIHLLTAYYYEDRGDGSQPDVWPKIYALLAAYRDPTVA